MSSFKGELFSEIPLTSEWLNDQEGFEYVEFRLNATELTMTMKFQNVTAEMGWNRMSLDYIGLSDAGLLVAVKKVVQGILRSVIMGL